MGIKFGFSSQDSKKSSSIIRRVTEFLTDRIGSIQEKQEQLDKLYENVKGKKGKIQKLEKEKAMLEQGLQNIRDLTEFR